MLNYAQIILADDDPEDIFIMKMMCKELHLLDTVHFVKDGKFVLDYLLGLREDFMPMLIVLDLNMPLLSGTQTLQALKQHKDFRNIPVIIYSTSLNEIQRKQCMDLGAKDYLIKPDTYEEGLKTMQHFYDFTEGTDALPAASLK